MGVKISNWVRGLKEKGETTTDQGRMNQLLYEVYDPIFHDEQYKEEKAEQYHGPEQDIEPTIWQVITNLRNSRAMGVDGMPLKELKEENIRKRTTADIIERIKAGDLEEKDKVVRIMVKSKTESEFPKAEETRLLSVLSAKYTLIEGYLYGIMKEHVNSAIPQYQVGFKPGKRMEQSTAALKKMIEGAKEDKTLAILTIDLKKAYDMIKREKVYEALQYDTTVPKHAQDLYRNITTGMKMRIGTEQEAKMIQYNNGIPQGSKLSPDAIQPNTQQGTEANGPATTPADGIRGQHNILRQIQGGSGNHMGKSTETEGVWAGGKQEIHANGNKGPGKTTKGPADANNSRQYEVPRNAANKEDDKERSNKKDNKSGDNSGKNHSGKKKHTHNKPGQAHGGNK